MSESGGTGAKAPQRGGRGPRHDALENPEAQKTADNHLGWIRPTFCYFEMQLLNMYMCVTVSDTDWDTDWVAKYSQSGKKTQDRPRLNVYSSWSSHEPQILLTPK